MTGSVRCGVRGRWERGCGKMRSRWDRTEDGGLMGTGKMSTRNPPSLQLPRGPRSPTGEGVRARSFLSNVLGPGAGFGEGFAGFQEGFEAGEDVGPAVGDGVDEFGAGLVGFVDDGEFDGGAGLFEFVGE